MITAEQARAELERRARAKPSGITPGQARAELDRRANAKGDQPSLLQQLFDVRNARTGESYLYGNRPDLSGAQQGAGDAYRIIGDTATRGLADKLAGPEAQAETAAARERTPDWVETPTDVATAVATSPYRIGGMAAGAGFGALEGAGSTYMHQPDWIPSASDARDILAGGAGGAVAGAGGAKLGQWGGDIYSKATGRTVPNTNQSRGLIRQGLETGGHILQGGDTPLGQSAMAIATGGYGPALSRAMRWMGTPAANIVDPAAGAAARDALAKMMIGMEK